MLVGSWQLKNVSIDWYQSFDNSITNCIWHFHLTTAPLRHVWPALAKTKHLPSIDWLIFHKDFCILSCLEPAVQGSLKTVSPYELVHLARMCNLRPQGQKTWSLPFGTRPNLYSFLDYPMNQQPQAWLPPFG